MERCVSKKVSYTRCYQFKGTTTLIDLFVTSVWKQKSLKFNSLEYVNITQLKLLHKSLNKITATCTALNTCKYKAKLNYTKAETRELFLKIKL